MLLKPNSDPTIRMSRLKSTLIRPDTLPIFYCPILASLFNLQLRFTVLSQQKWNPVWSSAAVDQLPQGFKCWPFRDCMLNSLEVMNGYLSYCCLSFLHLKSVCAFSSDLSKQSCNFIHTTDTQWIFSVFQVILCKPQRRLCVKLLVDHQFLKYSDQPAWHIQSLNSPFF